MAGITTKKPKIERVEPAAGIAGGEIGIHGRGFSGGDHGRPQVRFGGKEATLLVASDDFLIARVPEGSPDSLLEVRTPKGESDQMAIELGVSIADNLHPVANPVIDQEGNIFATVSGARGQKVPISIYKFDRNYIAKPFLSNLVNATGLALDAAGNLYVSSRHDGVVYQVTSASHKTVYAKGMGVATGIAFDADENLLVGDRTGTIFKVGHDRQIFVFATLEPSVAAYHLAFGPDQALYVTGPTTSSYDSIYRIAPSGEVEVFYRGLGRPQGLAFDQKGELYVVASLAGRRGVVHFPRTGEPKLAISGQGLVGLAFGAGNRLVLATSNTLYHLNWPGAGGTRPRP
ncbi:MAG: gluconolaconase [Acidobacteria bacterium]|nr:gluconolaconase [Acidobacteriota bacterium]